MCLVGAAVAATFCAGSAFAAELPRGGNITCQGPFSISDSTQSVVARHMSDARVSELTGLHGEPVHGLLLFPDDPHARLEMEDTIGTEGRVTSINIREKNSLWTVEGLKIGMTPRELAEANGRPVNLSGFRQMPGNIFATLAWLPRGDCTVLVVFSARKGMRFDPRKSETEVSSDDPRLARLDLRVSELILSLPEQALH